MPGTWRDVPLYRRHPYLLARDARYWVAGTLDGLREAYRRARVETADYADPPTLERLLDVYRREGARLTALQRQVSLLEKALAGVPWPGL
jgi:hypothetical protein